MKHIRTIRKYLLMGFTAFNCILLQSVCSAADHNDPNAINSIFSDIPVSAADLYDLFGFPSDDKTGGEKVVVALTFASIPTTGVFDTDMLYKLNFDPDPRAGPTLKEDPTLEALLNYAEIVKDKYLKQKAAEIRVTFNKDNKAKVNFIDFPGGNFSKVVDTNTVVTIESPDGNSIKTFIGGRDDAFFNDLPGFFRSINYAPQFYHVPHAMKDKRELEIPKTLLELEGNKLFNFDKNNPLHGQGVKTDLPTGSLTWRGNRFLKDEKGNFRFVYSGKDAQAGRNVNAIVFEIPLKFITQSPKQERIVRTWGESWVLKASSKIDTLPDKESYAFFGQAWAELPSSPESGFNDDIANYKRVDLDGVPFLDAALNEREDERQLANNINAIMSYDLLIWVGVLGLPSAP